MAGRDWVVVECLNAKNARLNTPVIIRQAHAECVCVCVCKARAP
jgi:hypothetical protein